jgi:hypothetical protein
MRKNGKHITQAQRTIWNETEILYIRHFIIINCILKFNYRPTCNFYDYVLFFFSATLWQNILLQGYVQIVNSIKGSSWSWSYVSWIYIYLCNQCLSPLKLWIRNLFMAMCTRYNNTWYSLSVTCDRSVVFSGYSGLIHKKTDCHDIAEILLKVALNTINLNQTRKSLNVVLRDGLCFILNDKRRFVPSKWPWIDVFACDLLCYVEQQQKMLAFHADATSGL